MSETPFFPEPPPLGLPAPLQPESEQDASEEQALRAMEEDYARTTAKQEAYGRAYKHSKAKLLRFARFLRAAEKAEDFVEDVVARGWINDLTGQCAGDEACIEAKLMAALKNRVIDEFRDQALKRETLVGRGASFLQRATRADVTSWTVEEDDTYRLIYRLLRRLPRRQSEVFFARRMLEMTRTETAEKFGISVKTVAAHLTLALFFLRKEIAAALGLDNIPELLDDEKEDTP